MKVALIGATGFIGRHLCDTHIGRGDSVSALVRNPRSAAALAEKGVLVVEGDLSDGDAVRRTCSSADAVYNLAGALGKWGTPVEVLRLVNTWAAGHVVRCAAEAGARRVVHTSTAGVSGPVPDGVCASEDCLPSPATEYERTKLAGEHAALEAHRATGMPLVVVRPAFVYGPGDTHKLSLFRAVATGQVALVNGGASRLHPLFVDDLVDGMIRASQRAPGSGDVYILAGPRPVTARKLLETIAWALRVPPPRLSLPRALLLPVAIAMEAAGRIIGREPPLTRSRLRLFSEHYAYATDKAREQLGFKPVVSLPRGARQTAQWYVGRDFIRPRGQGRRQDV